MNNNSETKVNENNGWLKIKRVILVLSLITLNMKRVKKNVKYGVVIHSYVYPKRYRKIRKSEKLSIEPVVMEF